MSIELAEFEYLRKFIKDESAIVLGDDKEYLVESRLMNLLDQEGYGSVQKMLNEMRIRPSNALRRRVVDAMTNNETWFFRDMAPFEAIKSTVLPDVITRRAAERKLTIWSAACSSGQEPYSLAMLILEYLPALLSWDVQIVATDLSSAILERAMSGRYTQLEVNRGLPINLLAKYFTREGMNWQLSPVVRRMVTFHQMNLADAWPQLRTPDLVMLRNVLIYFDLGTKREILARVARLLPAHGYLFLGCAETTLNLSDRFERQQCGSTFCYRLRG
jgi:chemotaxis protein methyltransferase CheR